MCGIPEAQLAISVLTTVASFQNDKEVYKRNTAAQDKTMEHANVAYLNDLSKIDAETSRAEQARSLEMLTMRQELTKNQAYALNSGFGNSLRVVQDISGKHDLATGELIFMFEKDIITQQNQEKDAYAHMVKGYSSLTAPTQPSLLGTSMQIASAGINYAVQDNKNRHGGIYTKRSDKDYKKYKL